VQDSGKTVQGFGKMAQGYGGIGWRWLFRGVGCRWRTYFRVRGMSLFVSYRLTTFLWSANGVWVHCLADSF
jgi:hypothetical protein